MSQQKKVNQLIAREIEYYSGNELKSKSPDNDHFLLRVKSNAFKNAEALLNEGQTHSLDTIRTYTSRGHFAEAMQLINSLLSTEMDESSQVEVLTEEIRIHYFKGDWLNALHLINKTMKLQVSSITTMSLHQMKSVCYFEVGELQLALKEVEKVEVYAHLFPKSHLLIFAELVKIKIIARSSQNAKVKLENLWMRLCSKKLNFDIIVALARVEIDLARLENKDYSDWAWLCYYLSDFNGDNLYRDLAILDLIWIGRISENYFEGRELPYRIREMMDEYSGKLIASTTVINAQNKKILSDLSSDLTEYDPHFFFLKKYSILIYRNERSAMSVKSEQQKAVLAAFKNDSITKTDFFKLVWGSQRFVPELHDNLIRTLVSRFKKQFGITIKNENGNLNAKLLFVVAENATTNSESQR